MKAGKGTFRRHQDIRIESCTGQCNQYGRTGQVPAVCKRLIAGTAWTRISILEQLRDKIDSEYDKMLSESKESETDFKLYGKMMVPKILTEPGRLQDRQAEKTG